MDYGDGAGSLTGPAVVAGAAGFLGLSLGVWMLIVALFVIMVAAVLARIYFRRKTRASDVIARHSNHNSDN